MNGVNPLNSSDRSLTIKGGLSHFTNQQISVIVAFAALGFKGFGLEKKARNTGNSIGSKESKFQGEAIEQWKLEGSNTELNLSRDFWIASIVVAKEKLVRYLPPKTQELDAKQVTTTLLLLRCFCDCFYATYVEICRTSTRRRLGCWVRGTRITCMVRAFSLIFLPLTQNNMRIFSISDDGIINKLMSV